MIYSYVMNLPSFSHKYFWDTNLSALDVRRHQTYIIERLLEHGDLNCLHWLNKSYMKKDIQKVIKNSKRLSAKTANFFSLYYNLPKGEIACLNQPYIQKQNRF